MSVELLELKDAWLSPKGEASTIMNILKSLTKTSGYIDGRMLEQKRSRQKSGRI